jgi:hypothetical protein
MEKISVQRRWFWGVSRTGNRAFLHRFETEGLRGAWLSVSRIHSKIQAVDPIVRKLNRQIQDGRVIEFPVEID